MNLCAPNLVSLPHCASHPFFAHCDIPMFFRPSHCGTAKAWERASYEARFPQYAHVSRAVMADLADERAERACAVMSVPARKLIRWCWSGRCTNPARRA